MDITQSSLFGYQTREERIPQKRTLRKLRMVDGLLTFMDGDLRTPHARISRAAGSRAGPLRAARSTTVQYQYTNGRLTTVTYPSGRQLTYTRDTRDPTGSVLGIAVCVECALQPELCLPAAGAATTAAQ